MNTFKGRGLVLREFNVGESDKIITLLLKERGRVKVSVRGGRKPKSKFLSGSQLFSYSDFVILDGGSFMSLAEVDLIESFFNIRNDYDKLCYGTYFLEMADKTILDGEPCDEILLLLIRTLSALSRDVLSPKQIARVFEIKFMQLSGYAPETGQCQICGNDPEGSVFFSMDGILCDGCAKGEETAIRFSKTAAKAFGYIMETGINELYRLKLNENILGDIKRATDLLIKYYLDIRLISAEMLDD